MNIIAKILTGVLAGVGVWGLGGFAVRTFGNGESAFEVPQVIRLLVGLAWVAVSLALWLASRRSRKRSHEHTGD